MIRRLHNIYPQAPKRGVILIAVLLSLTLLMVLIGSQVYVTSLTESCTENQRIETQSHFALASGLNLAQRLAALQTDSKNRPVLLDEDSFLINDGEITVSLYDKTILTTDVATLSPDTSGKAPSGLQPYASTPNIQVTKVVYKHPHRTRCLWAVLKPSGNAAAVLAVALLD